MPAANTSFATATTINTFPYDFSQTDINTGGVNSTVYYRFIAPPGSKVFGAWGFSGNIGAGYRPTVRAYTGPASAPVQVLTISSQNKPFYFPVTAGTEYFLEFTKNVDSVGPETLRVRVDGAPKLGYAPGSFVITDDRAATYAAGMPTAILSSLRNYQVNDYVSTVVPGEAADSLENGDMLFEDRGVGRIVLYDKTFTQIAVPENYGLGVGFVNIRTNKTTNRLWYSRNTNPVIVKRINSDNSVTHVATLTGNTSANALATNPDETILYFARNNTGGGVAIKRWDLSTNTAMADLVAAVFEYTVRDILGMDDGSIIASYSDVATNDNHVRHYSAAGALLHTYSIDPTTADMFMRMAYASDHPNSFWVWLHTSSGLTATPFKMINIRVSDGAVLASIDHTAFNEGAYEATETATPTGVFGAATSCPLLLMPSVGLYKGVYVFEPDKTDDTVNDGGSLLDLAIPDPTFKTGLLG